jgi:hypothetical protein
VLVGYIVDAETVVVKGNSFVVTSSEVSRNEGGSTGGQISAGGVAIFYSDIVPTHANVTDNTHEFSDSVIASNYGGNFSAAGAGGIAIGFFSSSGFRCVFARNMVRLSGCSVRFNAGGKGTTQASGGGLSAFYHHQ